MPLIIMFLYIISQVYYYTMKNLYTCANCYVMLWQESIRSTRYPFWPDAVLNRSKVVTWVLRKSAYSCLLLHFISSAQYRCQFVYCWFVCILTLLLFWQFYLGVLLQQAICFMLIVFGTRKVRAELFSSQWSNAKQYF